MSLLPKPLGQRPFSLYFSAPSPILILPAQSLAAPADSNLLLFLHLEVLDEVVADQVVNLLEIVV